MNRGKSKTLIITILLSCFCTFFVSAQNSYISEGLNGYSFTTHSEIDKQDFRSFGFYNGLSIGGRFGVFADFTYGFGETELYLGLGEPESVYGIDKIETIQSNNVNLVMGVELAVLKQSKNMPISFDFFVGYGFDYVFSDKFSKREYAADDTRYKLDTSVYRNFYQKDGMGFELGSSLHRDFFFVPQFALRVGANIYYRGYRYTNSYYIEDTNPDEDITDVDETEPILIERISREDLLLWGGVTGFSLRLDKAPVITLECKILFQDFAFNKMYFEPSIGIVQSFSR